MGKIYTLFLILLLLVSCGGNENDSQDNSKFKLREHQIKKDLNEIKEDGVLNAITIYSSTSYFLYRGQPLGFEYELLSRLAEEMGLKLKITVAHNINERFDMLNRGDGDIIAYGLTITNERKQVVNFTNHHYVTHQALVQRKPSNWRRLPGYKIDKSLTDNVIELIGDTVYVRSNSSYHERILNLEDEIGGDIVIDTLSGDLPTDEIIRMVVDGEIKQTIADYNIAAINKTYYPELDIDTPVSFSQRIAWAVRKNSPELLKRVNEWIDDIKKRDFYYVIYNKYFKNRKSYRRRIESDFYSKNTGKISQYDEIIKENANRLDWDWRLLASLIYQESRFRSNASSWAGAQGLMQLMPAAAREVGLKSVYTPKNNIEAGTRYLTLLSDIWAHIEDTTQRIKFVMASYNCGYGHVKDAVRLAEKFGDDPDKWDNNVENYILKLNSEKYYTMPVVNNGFVRGREPYEYVREIFLRYRHYKKFAPLENEKSSKA